MKNGLTVLALLAMMNLTAAAQDRPLTMDQRPLRDQIVHDREIREVTAQPAVTRAAASRKSVAIGAVVGFGAGAAVGGTFGADNCGGKSRLGCAMSAGATAAVIGAFIGLLVR